MVWQGPGHLYSIVLLKFTTEHCSAPLRTIEYYDEPYITAVHCTARDDNGRSIQRQRIHSSHWSLCETLILSGFHREWFLGKSLTAPLSVLNTQ